MPLLIAGTHSGCGKSTVTLGLLVALRRLGHSVQPFKAGPDFIDPGLHTMIAGRVSRNLDLWICGADYVRSSFAMHSKGADAVVIEGVMGLYDGADRSTAALASAIGANVVLVVDAYGMAESAGAIVHGFNASGATLSGVIFNRVASEAHYARLRASVADVEVLGYLPRDVQFSIPERHLGLHVAEDSPISAASLDVLADAIIKNIDMNRIKELSIPPDAIAAPVNETPTVRIAVARDRAFCFYYDDNLEMLRQAGAEIVPFSPLNDAALPADLDAVSIGGGYPELHAAALSGNRAMLASVRAWVSEGRPLYAECGGLMYLGRAIQSDDGTFEMAEVFPFETRMLNKRAALGYREVRLLSDCILGPEGTVLRGHEFHYSEITDPAAADGVKYNVLGEGAGTRVSSASLNRCLASYTHVHLGSRPEAARWFVDFIRKESTWKK